MIRALFIFIYIIFWLLREKQKYKNDSGTII